MKKIKKKIFVCILSFMIVICSLMNTCITAYASPINPDDYTDPDFPDWRNKLIEFMSEAVNQASLYACQFGAIVTGDYLQFMKNTADYFLNEDGTINEEKVTYDESTDTITMDCSDMLKTLAGQMGLTIFPANRSSYSHDNLSKAVLANYASNKNYVGYNTYISPSGQVKVYLCDFESYYVVGYDYFLEFYLKDTLEKVDNAVVVYTYNDVFSDKNGNYKLPAVSSISTQYHLDATTLRANVSFAYWSSMEMLQRFLGGSTYLGSSFGHSGTITIPVSDLEKDWEKAYNDILTELNGIKEATGERPTQQQIDDAIEKILGALEDIGGDTSGNNPGGNTPGGGDIDIDVSKLEEALEKIRAAIADAGGTNENLVGMKEVMSSMEIILAEIKNGVASQNEYLKILADIYALQEKMYKVQKLSLALDVADLVTEFVNMIDNGDTSVLDRVTTSLSNVANASQEHFPTSIPWDLLAAFMLFKADPVAPSYELPVSIPSLGINETVAIDLTGFEVLSQISRTLLSALFLLLLIHLTRKSTAPDEGDG